VPASGVIVKGEKGSCGARSASYRNGKRRGWQDELRRPKKKRPESNAVRDVPAERATVPPVRDDARFRGDGGTAPCKKELTSLLKLV